MGEELTLAVVLAAAVVDSVNPCAIGVILFLASVLLRVSDRRAALLRFGSVYIATVFVVYMLSGLGLVWFQHALIERGFAEGVGIGVIEAEWKRVSFEVMVFFCFEMQFFYLRGKVIWNFVLGSVSSSWM